MSDTPPTVHGYLDGIGALLPQFVETISEVRNAGHGALAHRQSALLVELADLMMGASTLLGMPYVEELDEKRVMDDNAQDWLP
jgi:hypothetical protein